MLSRKQVPQDLGIDNSKQYLLTVLSGRRRRRRRREEEKLEGGGEEGGASVICCSADVALWVHGRQKEKLLLGRRRRIGIR